MGGCHKSPELSGIDVSKSKVDACIRALRQQLSQSITQQGEAALIAWLRENGVGQAVMEASGGHERGWAEALRQAGIAVRIVDPKSGSRYFARSAGRLAKNTRSEPVLGRPPAGPVATMIAWFGETFASEVEPIHDPERAALDQLVTARRQLVRVTVQLGQWGAHRQPRPSNRRSGRSAGW